MDKDTLFSTDPQIRWKNAQEWAKSKRWTSNRIRSQLNNLRLRNLCDINSEEIDSIKDLPDRYRPKVKDWGQNFALSGSLNAWMIFVGPSPGASPTKDKKIHDLLGGAHKHRNPTLGRPHPSLFYPDTSGFFNEVRNWVEGAYHTNGLFTKWNDEFASLSSFLLVNLVKDYHGKAHQIPDDLLRTGAKRFWETVAPVAHPRLVIALLRGKTNLFELLIDAALEELDDCQIERLPGVTFPKIKNQLPQAVVNIPTIGPILISTVPTHPSYITNWVSKGRLKREDLLAFLGESVQKARELA